MNELSPVVKATIKNGHLCFSPEAQPYWQQILRTMRGEVEIMVRYPQHPPRSIDQNRYLWGCVIRLISRHTGEREDTQYRLLKNHFGVESTSNMTTAQFADFIEKVLAWAATELNLIIPEPDKVSGWEE